MLSGLLAARNRVRVVARGARHLAGLKACRFSQPVRRMRDLEFIVVTGARRVIEEQDGIAQRLARPVGKRPLRITKELIRQGKMGGFEMTLHAHLELPVPVQLGRIDDGRSNGFRGGVTRSGGFDVSAAGSMAALAIDPFRDMVAEYGLRW